MIAKISFHCIFKVTKNIRDKRQWITLFKWSKWGLWDHQNIQKQHEITQPTSWINSKISNEDNSTTLMTLLCCHYCWSLLCCDYWQSLVLWNSTSWSHLKLTVHLQLAFHRHGSHFLYIIAIWLLRVLKNTVLLCWM